MQNEHRDGQEFQNEVDVTKEDRPVYGKAYILRDIERSVKEAGHLTSYAMAWYRDTTISPEDFRAAVNRGLKGSR